MTAAVASSPLTETGTGRPAADLHPVPAEYPHSRGTPYLTPVPDCEPPFDDDPAAALTTPQIAGRTTPAPAVAASPLGTSRAGRPMSGVNGDRAGAIDTAPRPEGTTARLSGRTARPDGTTARLGGGTARQDGRAGRERESALRRSARGVTTTGGAVVIDGGPTTITAPGVPSWSSESDIGVRKTATVELPPAQRAASVFARALVEVLSGRRPLAQLRVHCAPDIYAGLVDRPPAGSLSLPHLLTVRVCEPADGVAEVSAAFRRADRVRALAFRIQGVDGRWRITALQVG